MPRHRTGAATAIRLLALVAALAIAAAFFLAWVDLSRIVLPSLRAALPAGLSGMDIAFLPMRYEQTVLVWLDEAQRDAGFMTRSTLENAYQSALAAVPEIRQARWGALALLAIPVLALISAIMLVAGRGWWEWPLLVAAIVPLAVGVGWIVALVDYAPALNFAGVHPGLGAWIGGAAAMAAVLLWLVQVVARIVRLFRGPPPDPDSPDRR